MVKLKSCNVKLIFFFFTILFIWIFFDRLTKVYFDSGQFGLSSQISQSYLNLFHFTLVHNSGAAFGIFSNSTYILGIVSLIISFLIILFVVSVCLLDKPYFKSMKFKWLLVIALSFICAGGIGNAIDRFLYNYVVDFICFDFIDFPVFNIADIGVTCGVMLTFVFVALNSLLNN